MLSTINKLKKSKIALFAFLVFYIKRVYLPISAVIEMFFEVILIG